MHQESLSQIVIRSVERPRLRYRIQSTLPFDARFHRVSSATTFATWYDTLGDGDTQHTPDQPVSPLLLGDFCGSTLDHLNTVWDAPAWRLVASIWPFDRTRPEALQLLARLRFQDDKREWYSVDLAKRSHNRSKSFDSRWREVPPSADGTPSGILHLIEQIHPHHQLLARLVTAISTGDTHAMADRQVLQRYCGQWDLGLEETSHLLDLVRGLHHAVHGFSLMDAGGRTVRAWKHKLQLREAGSVSAASA